MRIQLKFQISSEFMFDSLTGNIIKDGSNVIVLRGLKCRILTALLENADDAGMTKQKIAKEVWGKDDESMVNSSLNQQIYLLRKELDKIGLKDYILSRPGVGYMINPSDSHYEPDISVKMDGLFFNRKSILQLTIIYSSLLSTFAALADIYLFWR